MLTFALLIDPREVDAERMKLSLEASLALLNFRC